MQQEVMHAIRGLGKNPKKFQQDQKKINDEIEKYKSNLLDQYKNAETIFEEIINTCKVVYAYKDKIDQMLIPRFREKAKSKK